MTAEAPPIVVPAPSAAPEPVDLPLVPGPAPPDALLARRAGLLLVCLSVGVGLAAIVQAEPLQSANDRSRWSTVRSLVEHGTYRIDASEQDPRWQTIDKVRHEGHFYSSKPPLLATIVAGLCVGVEKVTGRTLAGDTPFVVRTLLVLVNLLPWTAGLVVLSRVLERTVRVPLVRLFVLATAALGTLLLPFLATLNNHVPAAACLLLACGPLVRILVDGSKCPLDWMLAGFLVSGTCVNELPAALLGLIVFGLLLRRCVRRTFVAFVPAALVPLVAFFVTNALATGGVKPFYTTYGTETYRYVHEGVPSYWTEPRGLDASTESPAVYAFHCLLGHHGILSLSPVFLLTVASWMRLRRDRDHPLRTFVAAGLVVTVAVLGFYLTRTANYNYGGNSIALRWMLWLVPLWLLGMVPALEAWGEKRSVRAAAAVLLAASVFSANWSISSPWRPPWLFVLLERAGFVDYSDPEPAPFDPPLTTFFRTMPAPSPDGPESPWIEWVSPASDGGEERLRLTFHPRDVPGDPAGSGPLRRIELRHARSDGSVVEHDFLVDTGRFIAGADPVDFVTWPAEAQGVSEEERNRTTNLLRGIPWPRAYRPGRTAYVKTAWRTDAFRCTKAASQVDHRATEESPVRRYRSDVWLCDEVPFGVLQFVWTVSDPETGEILSRRRFWASAMHPEPAATAPASAAPQP